MPFAPSFLPILFSSFLLTMVLSFLPLSLPPSPSLSFPPSPFFLPPSSSSLPPVLTLSFLLFLFLLPIPFPFLFPFSLLFSFLSLGPSFCVLHVPIPITSLLPNYLEVTVNGKLMQKREPHLSPFSEAFPLFLPLPDCFPTTK